MYYRSHHAGVGSGSVKSGILSVPGIAGFEWVPARIGCFGNKKYLFFKYNWHFKTGKTGTHSSADT